MSYTNEKIVAALAGIGHSAPQDFVPDPASDLHPDVQLFLASSFFTRAGTYRGTYGDWSIWMYQPAHFGINNGRLEIGHADGGNYTVVIPAYTRGNPGVGRYDLEEPDHHVMLTWGLSTFIRGLQPE